MTFGLIPVKASEECRARSSLCRGAAVTARSLRGTVVDSSTPRVTPAFGGAMGSLGSFLGDESLAGPRNGATKARVPQTQWARTVDGACIAYQDIGSGPTTLVVIHGWVSHLEVYWEQPRYARFIRRLLGETRKFSQMADGGIRCAHRTDPL